MTKEYLRVSELNKLIEDVVRGGFPQPLWVCGEIQGYDRNRGKNHIFFELVDKDPGSKNIIARIGLVLFAGKKTYVEEVLKGSENAFEIKDDIEVKFACRVDFYPPHGAVRLIVESIDPTFTLGRLAQEKQKLIALLEKKGVLDRNKRLALPLVPLHIGLITADDSAAYNDVCSELKKSGFGFRLYLRNALMQGAKAEKDIVTALRELREIGGVDAVVITRGGGSIAELSCFDSRMIAEEIADCPLPVLSGIGHEINVTITDMAAHTFAKTPTAIAQHLVGRVQLFLDELDERLERIMEGAQGKIAAEEQRLKGRAVDLQSKTMSYLRDHTEQVIRMREVIKYRPAAVIRDRQKTLDDTRKVFKKVVDACFSTNRVKLTHYMKVIDAYHPAKTIKRGFSITRTKGGTVIKSVCTVHPKDGLTTEVADGVITSKAERVEKT